MSVLTLQGSDGRNTGDVQPVSGSVANSPFTSAVGSAETPQMTGLAMISVVGQPIHVRFDKDGGVAADANDFLLPVGIHRVPCDGHVMSFIQEGSAATIYIEVAREVGA